jgi:hypothetical protein
MGVLVQHSSSKRWLGCKSDAFPALPFTICGSQESFPGILRIGNLALPISISISISIPISISMFFYLISHSETITPFLSLYPPTPQSISFSEEKKLYNFIVQNLINYDKSI